MTKYSKNYVLQNQMGQNQNIWQPDPSYRYRCTAELPWSRRKILAVLTIYLTGQSYCIHINICIQYVCGFVKMYKHRELS